MKSNSPPLPLALQEYLAAQARALGFADSSEYLRALIRQQLAGQALPVEPGAADPAPAAPMDAGEYARLRSRLDRLRGDLPHDPAADDDTPAEAST